MKGDLSELLDFSDFISNQTVQLFGPCFMLYYADIGAQNRKLSPQRRDKIYSTYFDFCFIGQTFDFFPILLSYTSKEDGVSMSKSLINLGKI